METNDNKASIACQSDIGKRRKNNEDAAFCGRSQYASLLLICDGIGGHRKGEVASSMIIDSIAIPFNSLHHRLSVFGGKHFARSHLKKVNHRIYKMSISSDEFKEMGSTAVGALVLKDTTYVFSVGDSRCYSYSPEKGLVHETVDQTYVQFLVDTGRITKSQSQNHPQKNLLLNAVGINQELSDVEEKLLDNNSYSTLLLCSDGLYNMVSDKDIEKVLQDKSLDTKGKAKKLINLALEAGGNDNIAVSLLEK